MQLSATVRFLHVFTAERVCQSGVRCSFNPGPSPGFSSRGGQKPEGGAKNQKEGPHFKNTVLDVCSNRWAKREIWAPISNGGRAPLAPPLATSLVQSTVLHRVVSVNRCFLFFQHAVLLSLLKVIVN